MFLRRRFLSYLGVSGMYLNTFSATIPMNWGPTSNIRRAKMTTLNNRRGAEARETVREVSPDELSRHLGEFVRVKAPPIL